MKPYIFLTENYLKNTVDDNADAVDLRTIDTPAPYTAQANFIDIYGNEVWRDIDTIILQDTNIVNMSVYIKNTGGTWEKLLDILDNDESTVLKKIESPLTASAIRFEIPEEGNPAEVRAKIGAYGFVCNLLALTDSNYKIVANQGDYRVVSGALVHWADYKKWNGKVKMENVTKEQFDLLTAQADKGEMTVVPYTELEATAIYECGVDREYSYGLDRKTELFNLELEFNEL